MTALKDFKVGWISVEAFIYSRSIIHEKQKHGEDKMKITYIYKLHYATEYPLTESWYLKKLAFHLIDVWSCQVAGNQQSRNKIFNIVRFIRADSQFVSPDP
ncbi:hypothetical protein AVEN_107513-1 [Araneus ventricosus]|uniref:Uncharacterized protein n=1 Tax=Araneus ventricosus TaxID=182803 RepID=A0A4Y2LN37_ARAVE|nr:hypothetical protein AVEN_99726-1 [Araneus ventricosus]GBN16032.1 hypothetical protein AVEN_25323-1 [Araneus ventricosus]GBN16062.1 hypothetical protein AVEN_73055-1 [Araneus ventricosus]GBN16081.1 hypothetical protein AVEN_107513-1 [Araneus ventricosus]